jgi:endonuclease YncB( thermonuclease family)
MATITQAMAQDQRVRAAHVVGVIDGHAMRLDDGIAVLAGIAVPLPSDGRYAQRWARIAQQKLDALATGKTLQFTAVGSGRDRYARLLAQVSDADGLWLQGEMLRAGLARVWVPSNTPDRLAAMLTLEDEARRARRGLWSDPFFAVLDAQSIGFQHLDRLQIVEGTVLAVATVRDTTYVNFGADWRRDFTLEIGSAMRRALIKAGRDPAAFKGHRLRVRGWPLWRNGPAIEIRYAAQIERLD